MQKLSPEYVNELNYTLYRNDFMFALDLALKFNKEQSYIAAVYCRKIGNDDMANVFLVRWWQSFEEAEKYLEN